MFFTPQEGDEDEDDVDDEAEPSAAGPSGDASDDVSNDGNIQEISADQGTPVRSTTPESGDMESVPRRPAGRAAAAAAAEDLVSDEMDQSSGSTAQKKNQANQATVALALEVGGCFPPPPLACFWRFARFAVFFIRAIICVCSLRVSVHACMRALVSLCLFVCLEVRVL